MSPNAPEGPFSTARLLAAVQASPLRAELERALNALAGGDFAQALARAQAVIAADSRCEPAWRLASLALEAQGDLAAALDAGQRALDLDPASSETLADLARIALTLGEPAMAAELLAMAQAIESSSALAALLATALRESGQGARAIETLDAALVRDDTSWRLWDERGLALLQAGRIEAALDMFETAARLAPAQAEPAYHRACARLDLADPAGASIDCAQALARARPDQAPVIRLAQAHAHLSLGQLLEGWAAYEARNDPDLPHAPVFDLPMSRLADGAPLTGLHLAVIGEQGLGDEMIFAGLLPAAIEALGPDGRLSLAVEARLVPLFARAYPQAEVSAHATVRRGARTWRSAPGLDATADAWIPMGSLAARFRREIAAFDSQPPGLRADPGRVADWRRRLAALGPGPKIGLTWKSMKVQGDRAKQYAPFAAWRETLQTPGVRFVNLQYGESAAEVEQARAWGVDIWTAPDLNLMRDMEGLAAFACALDLTLGVANASSALAGACGAPVWFLASPSAWPRLGTDRMPWYAQSRVFAAERFGEWGAPAAEMAEAVRERWAGGRKSVSKPSSPPPGEREG